MRPTRFQNYLIRTSDVSTKKTVVTIVPGERKNLLSVFREVLCEELAQKYYIYHRIVWKSENIFCLICYNWKLKLEYVHIQCWWSLNQKTHWKSVITDLHFPEKQVTTIYVWFDDQQEGLRKMPKNSVGWSSRWVKIERSKASLS